MKKYTVQKDKKLTIEIKKSGDYLVELVGQGAEAEIIGSFLAENNDKVDINITIHHKAKNTLANTTLRGVGRDQSSIRFFGRIIIAKDCGMSNSFLTERVLLLSDKAHAEAVPELEILTDDVKCSHAASISQIPEQQLFYLMSRGIPRKQAEDLIVEGFLEI
jgi:Fe-S cluster assembly scaffold protein SufB